MIRNLTAWDEQGRFLVKSELDQEQVNRESERLDGMISVSMRGKWRVLKRPSEKVA